MDSHRQGSKWEQPVISIPQSVNEEKPASETMVEVKLDIEHASVTDDPRKWSKTRKVSGLLAGLLVQSASTA